MSLPAKTNLSVPSIQEMTHLTDFCKVLASAPFYQKMGPGGVLAIFLTAREMGLPLMHCLNGGMYTFDGKVTLSAQLMNALIRNSGGQTNLIKLTDTYCCIEFVFKGKRSTYEYTIEHARTAGYLNKDNWKKHLRDMLYNRCLSGGARKFCPEAIMGAYIIGELDEDERSPVNVEEEALVEVNPEPPLAIEQKPEEKLPGFDEFYSVNNVSPGTDERAYLDHVLEVSKMSEVRIVNSAIKDPKKFADGFARWKAEKAAQGNAP